MNKPITKLATAAAVILIVVLGVTFLERSATPVWAIDQTIEALDKVDTIIVSGTTGYDDDSISLPFKLWIKLNDKNGNLFLRVESEREFVIVRGDTAYFRKPGTNKVKIMEGATIQNLQFWYQVMEFSPWLTGKMLKMLNSIASDWKETYGKNDKTGRDSVFVECSYNQLQASFEFIFDVESKLIVEAKHWMNTNRRGPPNLYATSFVYNEEISDEMFEFEIPEDAEVLNLKKVGKSLKEAQRDYSDALTLCEQAYKLLEEQKYTESIEIYKLVYKKYSYLAIGVDALDQTGMCYVKMGQYEKAIESFEKAIKEYPNSKRLVVVYSNLGYTYLETGQKDKALEAFKSCLRMEEDIRDPLFKDAQRCIEKIKAENKQ